MYISKDDSTLLKGIAILLIVMHNFCHWLPGCVSENEYTFRPENTADMLRCITQFGPHLLLNLFSYLGHYGVPVFLFISGYGLVRKYESHSAAALPSTGRFVWTTAKKLWLLMLPGLLLLFLSELQRCGHWLHNDLLSLPLYLSFLSNLMPPCDGTFLAPLARWIPARELYLGPWWYFSLTMQVYLIYRLLYARRGKTALLLSAVCTFLALTLLYCPASDPALHWLSYLRYNAPGCLLPFAMGVWTARYGLRFSRTRWLLALALFVGGWFWEPLWALSTLCVVYLLYPLCRIPENALRKALLFVGNISAALFVLHPVMRNYFIASAKYGRMWSSLLLYLFLSLAAATLLTLLLKQVPKKWKR